jgi:hypothetical protein
MNNSPTHVYLDLDVINNDSTTDDPPPNLRFEEIRNSPFLSDTGNYFVSIIRFSIQTGSSLPLFIPRIEIGQTNPNKTVYNMTFTYSGVNGSGTSINVEYNFPVIYLPNNSQPTPAQPLTSQDLTTTYYYVNAYQDFIYMINQALSSAWSSFSANVNTQYGSTVLQTKYVPFMVFDPETGRIVMNGSKINFEEASYNRVIFL